MTLKKDRPAISEIHNRAEETFVQRLTKVNKPERLEKVKRRPRNLCIREHRP